MSINELTRNCFLSGATAPKWLKLARLLFQKEGQNKSRDAIAADLSNAVLALCPSYAGHPDLRQYLQHAVKEGDLSARIFTSAFLQAIKSSDFHYAPVLDMLCRIALDAHYSSGLSPVGSLVGIVDNPVDILPLVEDAMSFVGVAQTITVSQYHPVVDSASELLILLLSCVSDMSQVTTSHALTLFASVNELMQSFRLNNDLRHVLETFVLSLSLLIGDDAKIAREAQMMQSVQHGIGRGDILGQGSNTDIISLSLLFDNMVTHRAGDYGSGSPKASYCLVGTFRWNSYWPPTLFCTQVVLAALTSLSQCTKSTALLWRAFVVGRLPKLFADFEKILTSENNTSTEWRSGIQLGLMAAQRNSELLERCDKTIAISCISSDEDFEQKPVFHDLLLQLYRCNLIEQSFVLSVDSSFANDSTPPMQREAEESGINIETYFESKLMPEHAVEEFLKWFNLLWRRDAGSHSLFADATFKRLKSLCEDVEVEPLSHLCQLLMSNELVLDLLALHVKMIDLAGYILIALEDFNCETVGDPQSAIAQIGDVVLFSQLILTRFDLPSVFKIGDRVLSAEFLENTSVIWLPEELSGDDSVAFNSWFKTVFDSSSEGIADEILRSTPPKVLLRISASVFSRAMRAVLEKKIDVDVLNNGISYFTTRLLNWTLLGVIQALIHELHKTGFISPLHIVVLQSLLTSPSCPQTVIMLCAPRILTILSVPLKGRKLSGQSGNNFDSEALLNHITKCFTHDDVPRTVTKRVQWHEQPKYVIRSALQLAKDGKAPALDVDRCLCMMGTISFLQLLWSEILNSEILSPNMESTKRIATFVLTSPRSSSTPPLMPIFFRGFLPSLIKNIDEMQTQSIHIELLVVIISSALAAGLQMELALRPVSGGRVLLGQPVSAQARQLASTLRSMKQTSPTSSVILQKLKSSQSFVASFPVFMEFNS